MVYHGNLFRPSEYFRPRTVEEAAGLLIQTAGRGRIIAGGTDILVKKESGIEALIDIADLGLNYIRKKGKGLIVGAGTPFFVIAESCFLKQSPYHTLAQAALQMGTPQVRNRATLGGNLCSASPCADSAPPLLALDAELSIVGPEGGRVLGVKSFFEDAGRNALEKGELLTEIRLPSLEADTTAAFLKKGRVAVADIALVNVAVRLTRTAEGTCENVRIAIGAVAPIPMRAREAENMLEGKEPTGPLLAEVANRASKETEPISDIRASREYRKTLGRVLVERALKEAIYSG